MLAVSPIQVVFHENKNEQLCKLHDNFVKKLQQSWAIFSHSYHKESSAAGLIFVLFTVLKGLELNDSWGFTSCTLLYKGKIAVRNLSTICVSQRRLKIGSSFAHSSSLSLIPLFIFFRFDLFFFHLCLWVHNIHASTTESDAAWPMMLVWCGALMYVNPGTCWHWVMSGEEEAKGCCSVWKRRRGAWSWMKGGGELLSGRVEVGH